MDSHYTRKLPVTVKALTTWKWSRSHLAHRAGLPWGHAEGGGCILCGAYARRL